MIYRKFSSYALASDLILCYQWTSPWEPNIWLLFVIASYSNLSAYFSYCVYKIGRPITLRLTDCPCVYIWGKLYFQLSKWFCNVIVYPCIIMNMHVTLIFNLILFSLIDCSFLWYSWYCFSLDSMNEIIDKYNTHSKNLGKTNQPSLDLNVCKSFLFHTVMLASK